MNDYSQLFDKFIHDCSKQMYVETWTEFMKKPEHKFSIGDETVYGGEIVTIEDVRETALGNCYAFMFDDKICFAY